MLRPTRLGLILACTATIAAIGAGVCRQRAHSEKASDPVTRLVESCRDYYPIAGRLTGGFAVVPRREPQTTTGAAAMPPADVRLAAAQVELRAQASPSPRHTAQTGVARLLIGDHDGAIALLQEAADAADPPSAAVLSDLAAALLARADAGGAAADPVRALDAAAAAVERDPSLAEAWFNLGLAERASGLDTRGHAAMSKAAALDTDTAWRAMAHAHIARLGPSMTREARIDHVAGITARATDHDLDTLAAEEPDILREVFEQHVLADWADAARRRDPTAGRLALDRAGRIATRLTAAQTDAQPAATVRAIRQRCERDVERCADLAVAFDAFRLGRHSWDAEIWNRAHEHFDRIGRTFAEAGLPEAGWLAIYDSLRAFRAGQFDRARTIAAAALRAAQAGGYAALAGRLEWQIGLIDGERGQWASSSRYLSQAATTLQRCRDREHEGAVHNLLADLFRLIGQDADAWVHQQRALRALGVSRQSRRQPILSGAAALAVSRGWHHAALEYERQAVAEIESARKPVAVALALGDEAATLRHLDRHAEAEVVLRRARALVADDRSDAAAITMAALATEEAATTVASDPERAERAATAAIDFYGAHGSQFALPHLLVLRGRARAALGRPAEAASDWRAGITVTDRQWRAAAGPDQRQGLQATRWALHAALATLEARHDHRRAFDLAEAGRASNLAHRLGPAARPRSSRALQAQLGMSDAALVYITSADRTFAWVVTRSVCRLFVVDRSEAALARVVDAATEAIVRRAPLAEVRAATGVLFEHLVAPARPELQQATRLIVVADGPLHRVPFAALWDEQRRKSLVEQAAILMAPSLSVSVGAGTLPEPAVSPRRGPTQTLVVGSPSVSPEAGLPALAGALRESTQVAAGYPDAVLLQRDAATRPAVLRGLHAARVLHFAGHAVPHHERPGLSRLQLARTGDESDVLLAQDIEPLSLGQLRLVVLAACQTADGRLARGEGLVGLSSAFLAAGARSVVSMLWPVDDRASVDFQARLHEGWRLGLTAEEAVRRAQVAVMHEEGRHPAAWAGAVVSGVVIQRSDTNKEQP